MIVSFPNKIVNLNVSRSELQTLVHDLPNIMLEISNKIPNLTNALDYYQVYKTSGKQN